MDTRPTQAPHIPFIERAADLWKAKTLGSPQLHEMLRAQVSYQLKMPLSLVDGSRLCLAVINKEGKAIWSLELPMALDHSSDNAIDGVTFSYEVASLRRCKPAEAEPAP